MEETIPYGAMPPEPEEQEADKDDATELETTQEEQQPADEKQQPEMDYQKSYLELQKKFGEHSNVVGELRKQNQTLAQQMEELKRAAAQREEAARNAQPPTDYEKMLAEIAKKFDDGEITPEQALIESNKITRQWSKAEAEAEKQALLQQARQEVQSLLSEKDAQQVVGKFHESNPDFKAMQEAGQLDQLKAEDPLLDDLSAYWKAQALKAQELATAKFEEGKKEALRVAAGSERAGKVLSDPGKSMQTKQQPKGPLKEADIKASMLATLKQ